MRVLVELDDLRELRHAYQVATQGDFHPATKRTNERIHEIVKEAEILQAKYHTLSDIRKMTDCDPDDSDQTFLESLERGYNAFQYQAHLDDDVEKEGFFMASRDIPIPDEGE